MATYQETGMNIDYENVFSPQEAVALQAIESAIRVSMTDSGMYPRGTPDAASESRVSTDISNRIEEHLAVGTTATRRRLLQLLMMVGGEREGNIARRLILQVLGTDPTNIDPEQITDVTHAEMTLGNIGGPAAFQMLLSLREHPNAAVAFVAGLEAARLYSQHPPRNGSDWGMAEHYADEETDRRREFEELYPDPRKL